MISKFEKITKERETAENTEIPETDTIAEYTAGKKRRRSVTFTIIDGPLFDEPRRKQPLVLKIAVISGIILSVVCGVIRVLLENRPSEAEWFYLHITRYLQALFGAASSLIPFSLAETLIVLLPLILIYIAVFFIRCAVKTELYRMAKTALVLITVLCFFFCNYILNLSVLYCRPSLCELADIKSEPPHASEVCAAAYTAVQRISEAIGRGGVVFSTEGASVCPYTFSELDKLIDDAFDRYAAKHGFVSPYGARAKIISMSDYMTYTHISGIYTQYTGESNININYPEYIVCATIAHEKAHQRGIAPEDEANILAMIVLAESGDPYLEYCGYMSVFNELMHACAESSVAFYAGSVYPTIPDEVFGELAAYSRFFRPYSKSAASKAASAVNDAYLKLNGEKDGVKSYGMVTDTAVNYIMSTRGIKD